MWRGRYRYRPSRVRKACRCSSPSASPLRLQFANVMRFINPRFTYLLTYSAPSSVCCDAAVSLVERPNSTTSICCGLVVLHAWCATHPPRTVSRSTWSLRYRKFEHDIVVGGCDRCCAIRDKTTRTSKIKLKQTQMQALLIKYYTPFTRWSWLDELARRALDEQLPECLQYYTIQMTR